MPVEVLTGVSEPIGGFIVHPAGAIEGFVSIPGATVGMTVVVTPTTYPGDGINWEGFVSSAGVVTIKVTSIQSGLVPSAVYNVQVSSGSGSGTLVGGVNKQTANYPAVGADNGKLISFSGSTALTLTLPATPPTTTWTIFVENATSKTLTVTPNGLDIDGAAGNLALLPGQGVFITTDGANYFTERGIGTFGGVNAQTGNYPAVASDNGKLISFSGSTALTLTLPAAPPSKTWAVFVQNLTTQFLTISPNSLDIDGDSANLVLLPSQGVYITTDGANYFTERGASNANVLIGVGVVSGPSGSTFGSGPASQVGVISFPTAIARAWVTPRDIKITRVIIQSDTGPTGIGDAAVITFTLCAATLTPGTPLTQAAFLPVDSAITAAASGVTAANATITSFTAGSSVSVPAGTLLLWLAVTSGATPTTLTNFFAQIFYE